MRRLPGILRLLIVLSFTPIEALIMYLTVYGKERGIASLLVFSGILAALLFSWAIALALEFFLLIVYLLIDIAFKGWSYLVITSFVVGTLTDLFLVVIIGFLWYAWQLAEEAKRKEKELVVLKDQFIANVHHELRSPLSSLLGSLDILRDDR